MAALTVWGLEIREEVLAADPEPKGECGCGVDRPKCMFELGGDCPCHEIRSRWHGRLIRAERAARSSGAGDFPMEAPDEDE